MSAISRSILGELVFLGTGTSVGVPTIGCECTVCTSGDDVTTACAVRSQLACPRQLVDRHPPRSADPVAPRTHLLIHAIAFTHAHADHLFGLDDVRLFPFRLGHAVPIYCEAVVEAQIRKAYFYAFSDQPHTLPVRHRN